MRANDGQTRIILYKKTVEQSKKINGKIQKKYMLQISSKVNGRVFAFLQFFFFNP